MAVPGEARARGIGGEEKRRKALLARLREVSVEKQPHLHADLCQGIYLLAA